MLKSPTIICASQRRRRLGFTFIEVLFAVILLGVGFIMIAAIFPAGLEQTSATVDDTAAGLVSHGAFRLIEEAANNTFNYYGSPTTTTLFPHTGVAIQPFGYSNNPAAPQILNVIGSNSFITPDHLIGWTAAPGSVDRRYGWVGFYRRDTESNPFAQVFLFILNNPNFTRYTQFPPIPVWSLTLPANSYYHATVANPPPTASITPPPATATTFVTISYNSTGLSTVTFMDLNNPTNGVSSAPAWADSGAFMLVAANPTITNPRPAPAPTQYNINLIGRVFRLSTPPSTSGLPPVSSVMNATTSNTFQLQPGWDLDQNLDPITFTANVFMIGRAPVQPSLPVNAGDFSGPFTGPMQDVAVVSTYIRVN